MPSSIYIYCLNVLYRYKPLLVGIKLSFGNYLFSHKIIYYDYWRFGLFHLFCLEPTERVFYTGTQIRDGNIVILVKLCDWLYWFYPEPIFIVGLHTYIFNVSLN